MINTTRLGFDNTYVLLMEKATTNLNVVNKGKDYILEGVAAVFGIENNNARIYEESEYLPHLDYLQKKITQNRLLGELDHPEKFDTSLKHVSHIIQALDYDKKTRTLRIKVKLLDTPAGMIARALVDAGVPISISSRAAGVVKHDKRVQIKKIFTFDLVADPGFEEAQLERVNESISSSVFYSTMMLNESVATFYDVAKKNSITTKLEDITQQFSVNEINTRIYKIDENQAEMLNITDKKNNDSPKMEGYVTIQEMNEYSLLIKKELDATKKELANIKASQTNESSFTENTSTLEERFAKIEKYTKYLAEMLDTTISYTEHLAENLDKNISYSNYLAENLDGNIVKVENSIKYANYLAENLDKNISYGEYLAENLDKNISYSNYLAENLDKNISYSNYLAENLDKGIRYSEYVAEKLGNSIAYTEYIAENINKSGVFKAINEDKTKVVKSEVKKVNESATTDKINIEDYRNISSKVNELLTMAKNKKAVNESEHFLRFLNQENKAVYESLDATKKEKVKSALKENFYNTESEVVSLIKMATAPVNNDAPKFLSEMPAKYVPIWESLNESEKGRIIAQSKIHTLNTAYQIKNFWETRGLEGRNIGVQKLNENEQVEISSAVKRGYDNAYLKNIAEEIGKTFGKK
jgi:hypothetical protein